MSHRSSFHLNTFGRTLAAAALVSLAACGSDPIAPGDGQALSVQRMNAVGASVLGTSTSDGTRQRTVITDATSWTRVWAELNPDPGAGGSAPTIDFSKDMIVAAVMPLRPSSGYQIEIERVTEFTDHIEAAVVERVPAADCVTLTVVTRPFDAVRVPRRDKSVRFVERTETQSCGSTTKNDTVQAPSGKAVDVRGVHVTLRSVVNDSRCPMNAVCIWEGDATVSLRFEQGTQSSDVTLHTNAVGGQNTVTVGGIEFRLAGLTPFPVAGQSPPDQSSYTALLVTR